jgi:hypothetical protein
MMSKRDELKKQWAEYESIVKDKKPENMVFKTGNGNDDVQVTYYVGTDVLSIWTHDFEGHVSGAIDMSGDEAEQMYRFLSELYG